jgi:hypothetical protein
MRAVSEQQQPQIEEKPFTEAELELLRPKLKAYEDAAEKLNECMGFLKKQHGVSDNEGWQLGQRGFVRRVEALPNGKVETKQPVTAASKPAATKKQKVTA